MTPTPQRLVDYWLYRATRMQWAHYDYARILNRRHYWLGIPAAGLSVVVGGTVFAALSKSADLVVQVCTSVMSLIAALLTSFQTVLKYSESAERHRVAGANFAHLRHTIELIQVLPPESDEKLLLRLSEIEEQWNKIRQESPTPSTGIWQKVASELTFERFLERHSQTTSDA